jgi:hypothetical protein
MPAWNFIYIYIPEHFTKLKLYSVEMGRLK